MDQQITDSHLPGQYLDISQEGQYLDTALVPGQHLDMALVAGKYKIYFPAKVFDPPMQSVT